MLFRSLKDKQVDAALDVLSEYGVSNDCKALLKHTLRVAPNKRYGLDQIMENSWYREYLPDLSKMVSRKTEYDQSDEEVRLVLSQAERLSRKIIETGSALDEFDDEMAAEVADELLGSGGDFSFIRRHGRSKDTDDMTIEHQQ